jgi:hypothetical protein
MTYPFEYTRSVQIELSNLCNMAWLHRKCMASLCMESCYYAKEPTILPARVVYSILDSLGSHEFNQVITFNLANEPMIDPRLFQFVEYAKVHVPQGRQLIQTNGSYLSLQLARELHEAGAYSLEISMYGDDIGMISNLQRQIDAEIMPCRGIVRTAWDNRLTNYDKPVNVMDMPCYAPLIDLAVDCFGKLQPCCNQWARSWPLGDLNTTTLDYVAASAIVREAYRRLSQKDRFTFLCQRCDTGRGWEYIEQGGFSSDTMQFIWPPKDSLK